MDDEQIARLAVSLTDRQRQRLLDWPDRGSTFFRAPLDEVALELVALGIGADMPWKRGRQMGLTSKLGLKLHLYLTAPMEAHRG